MNNPHGHRPTMSEWVSILHSIKGIECDSYKRCLLDEESGKVARLESHNLHYGLPVYRQIVLAMPMSRKQFKLAAGHLLGSENSRLAIRMVSKDQSKVLLRKMDLTIDDAWEEISSSWDGLDATVRIAEYQTPDYSGTLICDHGNIVLEIVDGEHSQLSGGTASDIKSCWFRFPSLVIRYSADAPEVREFLHKNLCRVLKLATGLTPQLARDLETDIYAEFHWSPRIGYRFIECSRSVVWTGAGLC